MEATDKRIAELEAQIRAMLASGVGTSTPAASDADWIAIDLAAMRAKDPTTAGLFGRHAYDIPVGGRVYVMYDPDYADGLERNGCFPYVGLTTKRREIAALLRDGGMTTPPAWWNTALTVQKHNQGIQAEIARLEGEIAKLRALLVA